MKKMLFFLIFEKKNDCGYTLEPDVVLIRALTRILKTGV